MHSDHESSSALRKFWRHVVQVNSQRHEYTLGRHRGHFGGSRLFQAGVDKVLYSSIHYDIRIDVEVFDEGVTMSAPCITGET